MQLYEAGGIGKLPKSKVLRIMDEETNSIVQLRTSKTDMNNLYSKISQNGNLTQH
jgi:hypothetical protein